MKNIKKVARQAEVLAYLSFPHARATYSYTLAFERGTICCCSSILQFLPKMVSERIVIVVSGFKTCPNPSFSLDDTIVTSSV